MNSSMNPLVPAGDTRVVTVRQALSPFAWRGLTPETLSRRVVAAIDHAPATPSGAGPRRPRDERIGALVEFLACCRWQSLTVDGLSRHLVTVLDVWQQERAWFDIQLAWLLDGNS